MTNKTKYVLPFIIIMLAVLVIYMFISLSNSCFYLNCGGSLDYGEVGGICCVYETVFENPKKYLTPIITGVFDLFLLFYWIRLLVKK
ncbi:hypothetical protein HOD30_02575 [Candidatus Peregrinibacteria bacterium]|nr:hypothetical protein [Candidatus Peregrinibacteria bacterium]MBT5823538.1 hypothetical protein [Candidatus Peregrinibacteria bacterium]